MKLLSVDIGAKNLGWCVVDSATSPPTVTRAEVSNIDGGTIRESIDNLIELLKDPATEVETVLIEQQPLRHARMLSLMHALYGALRALGRSVEIVSPRLRVSYLGLAKDVTYAQRKKTGVARVRELYGSSLLEGQGKKLDDVCDAILQALAWLAKPAGKKRAPQKKKTATE